MPGFFSRAESVMKTLVGPFHEGTLPRPGRARTPGSQEPAATRQADYACTIARLDAWWDAASRSRTEAMAAWRRHRPS
jgi:hypothetical protein